MTMPTPNRSSTRLDAFAFQAGEVRDVEVGYWTMGTLAADRGNVLVLCHGASGDCDWALPFCRPGGAFDPDRWFIVSFDLIGGGRSSRRRSDPDFPLVYVLRDLSRAILAVLDTLGIDRVAAFCGPSLASLVGIELAALRPGSVGALALWNGGVRADGFAAASAEGLCATIASGGQDAVDNAVRSFLPIAVGPIGLAKSSRADRDRLAAMLADNWKSAWLPEELVSRYGCVATSDVAAAFGGDAALAARLSCPVLFLNSMGDMLFAPDDVHGFAAAMAAAETRVCDTLLGHVSTNSPPSSPEFRFFDSETAHFFADLGR